MNKIPLIPKSSHEPMGKKPLLAFELLGSMFLLACVSMLPSFAQAQAVETIMITGSSIKRNIENQQALSLIHI